MEYHQYNGVKPSFWSNLNMPVFSLAPMEDVTETSFREIVLNTAEQDCLHVLFTEFTSTDGLCNEKGRPKVSGRLVVSDSERQLLSAKNVKIVAQIWGTRPENFFKSAQLITENYQFDGIDINLGCPVKKIVRQGGCSALIGKYDIVNEIIKATQEGTHLPVSVKTRTGTCKPITEEWISFLLDCKPAAIILHGRTQKQMSEVPADWTQIQKAVELRDQKQSLTRIIGNGDVKDYADGLNKCTEFGCDGVMVGRGIFSDPWFFNSTKFEPSITDRFNLLWKHTLLHQRNWGDKHNFLNLRRFYKIYINNFDNAQTIRMKLMETFNIEDVVRVINDSGYMRIEA